MSLSKIPENDTLPRNKIEEFRKSAKRSQWNSDFINKITSMDPVMGLAKNDTLSRSGNPENSTLFSGMSPYGKIRVPPTPRVIA